MNFTLHLISFVILSCFVFVYTQDRVNAAAGGRNLTFYIRHTFDGGVTFQPRTTVKLIPRAEGRYSVFIEGKNTIKESEVAAFKALLEKNDLYTIRVSMEGNSEKDYVKSSLPACDLMRSGFKEDIQAFLNRDSTKLNAISYSSPQMTIPQPCNPARIRDFIPLQTKIRMGEETKVPALPLHATGLRPIYLKDVKLNTEEEQKPQSQANQPFLYRYWYVVLGLALYLLLGGSEPPKKENKGQAAPADRSKAN